MFGHLNFKLVTRMYNFWPKKWSRSLKKFEWWSLTRDLLKQYLTEKHNGCLRNGCLREVVAIRELTVKLLLLLLLDLKEQCHRYLVCFRKAKNIFVSMEMLK